MIEVYNRPCVRLKDICKHFNTTEEDYEFLCWAEYGEYYPLDIGTEAYADLLETIATTNAHPNSSFYQKLVHERELIEYLRDVVPLIYDICLIFVC